MRRLHLTAQIAQAALPTRWPSDMGSKNLGAETRAASPNTSELTATKGRKSMIRQRSDRVSASFFGFLLRYVLAGILVLGLSTAANAAVVISPDGLLVNAQKGFDREVATFTSNDSPAQPASAYSATITWGDGTPGSVGTIKGPVGGVFSVTASHTYAHEGNYTMTVQITDSLDSTTVSATTPLTVLPSI